jgi:hypothetical protein
VIVVSNFTEFSTADEIIEKLDEYIPCLDDDRQFIQKYRRDFIYHYNNNFCNLALFSFHYIYMFIVNTSMVKYYAFDEKIIRNQTGNKFNTGLELFFYFGQQPEKKAIHNNVITDEARDLHIENVGQRDKIAHSCGTVIQNNILINYINNCFNVLKELQLNVINQCCQNNKIQSHLLNYDKEIVDSLCSGNTTAIEGLITNFMKDFHLNYKDLKLLKHIRQDLNAISYFLPYISITEGVCFLDWDESLNLHKAIYDDFCSKYEQAFDSSLKDVLNENKVFNTLKELYSEVNIDTLYNILHKLMEISKYWVPFGSQRIKESIIV